MCLEKVNWLKTNYWSKSWMYFPIFDQSTNFDQSPDFSINLHAHIEKWITKVRSIGWNAWMEIKTNERKKHQCKINSVLDVTGFFIYQGLVFVNARHTMWLLGNHELTFRTYSLGKPIEEGAKKNLWGQPFKKLQQSLQIS